MGVDADLLVAQLLVADPALRILTNDQVGRLPLIVLEFSVEFLHLS